METCPSCNCTMFSHEQKGPCRDCDEKICPGCYYGTSYTCETFKAAQVQHECTFCRATDYKYTMYWIVYNALGKFACSECAEAILLGK